MAGVVCRQGLVDILDDQKGERNNWTLHLFQNDVTPTDTFSNASVTEATFSGYASVPLNSWGDAFVNAANIGESDETLRTFTHNGGGVGNTIYGYFIRDGAGDYVAGERNPAGGTVINAAAQVYPVWPRITLQNA